MTTSDRFDPEASQRARDEAIRRVDEAADVAWKQQAHAAIVWLAVHRATFTTDDVWRRLDALEILGPREPRALGALMRTAKRRGLIRPLNRWIQSERVACHRRDLRLWESLVFGSGS